jgi:hypothetical protein
MLRSAKAYESLVSSSPPSITTVGEPVPVHLTRGRAKRSATGPAPNEELDWVVGIDGTEAVSALLASPPHPVRGRLHAPAAISVTAEGR